MVKSKIKSPGAPTARKKSMVKSVFAESEGKKKKKSAEIIKTKEDVKTTQEEGTKTKEVKPQKPQKRLSHNAEMDHCSLEDEN